MKRLIYLALLFVLILSGCQKEPMIRLSEERQAALSIERIEEKGNESLEDTNNSLIFEPQTFIAYDDDYLFEDISTFIPIQPNQVHVFDENGLITQQYLDYVDSSAKILQVREVAPEETTTIYYAWGTEQVVQLKSEQGPDLPINRTSTATDSMDYRLILLQVPLQKGNEWAVNDQLNATITNLYQEISLNGSTLNDVIEVTYQSQEGETTYYYARDLGLVAITYPQGRKLLTDTQIEARFAKEIEVFQPSIVNQGIQLTLEMVSMSWQTNDQLDHLYTNLFQSLGFITSDVQVNSIQVNGDLLVIDFSPGVVAAFNTHPAKEEGVIPAIATTLGKQFGVEKVQLTVNGVGLLPDRLSYPVGGVWLVREDLIVSSSDSENTDNSEIISEVEIIEEETTVDN